MSLSFPPGNGYCDDLAAAHHPIMSCAARPSTARDPGGDTRPVTCYLPTLPVARWGTQSRNINQSERAARALAHESIGHLGGNHYSDNNALAAAHYSVPRAGGGTRPITLITECTRRWLNLLTTEFAQPYLWLASDAERAWLHAHTTTTTAAQP